MATSGGTLQPSSQNLSVLSTPVRGGERDRDRHPFPQSAHPSPASSIRQTTSSSVSASFHSLPSSATAPSSSIQISPQTLTVEALLQQHASTPDPKMAALEQAVSDRNVLSAQNSQLWKLIEKQRAGYNQILKELERIRGERDSYKGKLANAGGLSNGSSSGERRQKTTSERGARPSLDLPSATSSPASAYPPSSHPRQPLPRHNSDDTATTPRNANHHQLHPSRSFEPMSARISDNQLQSNGSGYGNMAGSPPPPPPASAPAPMTSSRQSRPSPSPLVVTQAEDYSTSSAMSSSPDSAFSKQSALSEPNITTNKAISNGIHAFASSTSSSSRPVYPRKSSIADSVSSVMTTGSSMSISTPPTSMSGSAPGHPASAPYSQPYPPNSAPQSAQSAPGAYNSSPTDYRQNSVPTPIIVPPPGTAQAPGGLTTPTNTSTAVQSQQQQQRMLSPVLEARPHALSRESRISLPDEARQYIANMGDSPAASPHAEAFSPKSKLSTSVWPPPTSTTPTDSGQESEFLDMGDEDSDDDESEIEGTGDVTAGANDPAFDSLRLPTKAPQGQTQSHHERDHATYYPPQPPYLNSYSSSNNSSREDVDSVASRRQDRSRVGAEEFPLPPPSHQFAQRGQAGTYSQESHIQPYHGQQSSLSMQQGSSTSSLVSGSSPSKQTLADSRLSEAGQQSDSSSQQPPAHPAPAAFRALPLLSSDLPHTAVTVSHSFVRPNDRGKEVLSFIVFVNPGNGKDGWKVEKMYSDVLGLDQRVRSSVGKGVIKKIGNLPEGKLWKDHAPAKVDQRKAVLENYLQTLIRLPVKNNDEVIAFFTSDIVREQKAPVMQAGHKEGYLTKRGKNFGGWKTRFFVLQGPVLEYYDCRGGAHLGSIQITGAQIARQHRTEKAPNNDDEKEYRHAFLIVEAKKGPGGNHPRHVLCAESDEDRDSWVEMLVRYYTGTYSDELVFNASSGVTSVQNSSGTSLPQQVSQPRSSTSTEVTASSPAGPRTKATARGAVPVREEISRGSVMPISQLPPDASNAKLFQAVPTQEDYARSSSPSRSLEPSPAGDRQATTMGIPTPSDSQKRMLERSGGGGGGLGLPSSLPDSSPLSAAASFHTDLPSSGLRANSELGHYPDLQDNRAANRNHRQTSMDQHRPTRDDGRKSFHPSLAPSSQTPPDRVPSPEKDSKVKISGPMNGAPIPHGLKFGGKDAPAAESSTPNNDRREKAKSRSFWGFGKGDKQPHATFTPRAVFGVPLEEALEISQICHLPSIVFRSIQYLESKKADQEEGIYRLSGSSAVIKSLKDMFNNEGDVDLLASDEYWDPHAIAGLLKSFLRELPSSILTRELHFKFLSVIDFVDPQERIRELSQLIAALPLANYSLLRALTAHLILVVQNSNVNKMTMRNVGIVFSPTLGIPAGVFSLMLGEFNRVFNVETDAEAMASREVSDEVSDPLRRNSRQYSDAAADQLLGLSGRTLSTAAEETQSDGDDFSIQDESGPETTEGEMAVESTSSSPASIRIHAPDSPSTPKQTKASHMAATKGLNVSITPSDRGNRHSRIVGLPPSPRPHHSPARQDVSAPPLPQT